MRTWTKANGAIVLIATMSDAHLENTIALLERGARRSGTRVRITPAMFDSLPALRREREARDLARGVGIILPMELR